MGRLTCFFWLTTFLAGVLLPGGCARQKNPKNSGKLTIAAAANMQFALEEIVRSFTEESGIQCEMVISSSGKLTAQIKEGAPYDVFLSADMRYPETLFNSGHAVAAPEIYARGQLVLWLADSALIPGNAPSGDSAPPEEGIPSPSAGASAGNVLEVLTTPDITHIALANPGTAPYGVAAEAFMRQAGLYERLASKLVYGESISQVNHFMHSGAVEAGFTALSALLASDLSQRGGWIRLDTTSYPPIAQGVVILNNSDPEGDSQRDPGDDSQRDPEDDPGRQPPPSARRRAQQFYDFLFSARCSEILREHGYLVSEEK